jgi:hypothetical protein
VTVAGRALRFAGATALATAAGCGGVGPSGTAAPDAGTPTFLLTDPLEREIRPFEVISADGRPYDFPFLGGFDVPRPQLVDIDGDGDLDLFLQKYRGELMFFENVGTATEPEFVWRTSRYQDLNVGEWARFHDMTGNGRPDLFMELPSSYMQYYENVGTASEPRFEARGDSIKTPGGRAIFADAQNIPYFFDVDCNGRTDLFLGRIDGTVARFEFVEFADDAPVFELVDERFENIEIVAVFGVPGEPPPLEGPGSDSRDERPTLHGANSMAFADWNRNGAPDLFWGDFFEPGVLLLENIGTCARPNLEVEPVPVPADPIIQTSGYNSPAPGDLNGDGHLDLIVGVLGGAFNPNRTSVENLLHYSGSADGTMRLETRRFLFGLDVGSESVPALGDLTGNGAPDLLIGSKFDPETSSPPALRWYENVGTARAPEFEFRATLPEVAHLNGAPVLADLTGDGRLDLLVGTFNEGILWYRNEGTDAPRFVSASDEPIARLSRGSYTSPALGDLTGNGLLDLVVGEASGELNYFRNVGSTSRPEFQIVTEELGGINVGSRSAPLLVDVDGDGDLDLLVGEESRGLLWFENIGSPTEPRFESEGVVLEGRFPRLAAPRLVDIDGDGTLDMILGDQGGGLVFFRNVRGDGGR